MRIRALANKIISFPFINQGKYIIQFLTNLFTKNRSTAASNPEDVSKIIRTLAGFMDETMSVRLRGAFKQFGWYGWLGYILLLWMILGNGEWVWEITSQIVLYLLASIYNVIVYLVKPKSRKQEELIDLTEAYLCLQSYSDSSRIESLKREVESEREAAKDTNKKVGILLGTFLSGGLIGPWYLKSIDNLMDPLLEMYPSFGQQLALFCVVMIVIGIVAAIISAVMFNMKWYFSNFLTLEYDMALYSLEQYQQYLSDLKSEKAFN